MNEVYVVCQNFNTENVRVFAPSTGWTTDTAELYDTEYAAWKECQSALQEDNASIEKFITTRSATKH